MEEKELKPRGWCQVWDSVIFQALLSVNPKGLRWGAASTSESLGQEMFPVSLALGQGLVRAHMLAGDSRLGDRSAEFPWSPSGRDMPSGMSCPWALPSAVPVPVGGAQDQLLPLRPSLR